MGQKWDLPLRICLKFWVKWLQQMEKTLNLKWLMEFNAFLTRNKAIVVLLLFNHWHSNSQQQLRLLLNKTCHHYSARWQHIPRSLFCCTMARTCTNKQAGPGRVRNSPNTKIWYDKPVIPPILLCQKVRRADYYFVVDYGVYGKLVLLLQPLRIVQISSTRLLTNKL